MEALEFLQCYHAMCYYYNGCTGCEAQDMDCELTTDEPEKLVAAVEEWAKAHPEEAADATKPKRDETCSVKPEDFVNHFITEMLMRHEEQIEKLIQNVEKLMQPVNAVKPKRTRKDVLIAAFPDAEIADGYTPFCPKLFEKKYNCRAGGASIPCNNCKTEYWLAEAEEVGE